MKDRPVNQPMVKAWRPQGFAGVEVTIFPSVFVAAPKAILPGYDLVVTHNPCVVHYKRSSDTFDRNFERSSLFFSQNAGEPCGFDPLPEIPLNGAYLRLDETVLSLGEDRGQVYFPTMTAPEALNESLARLTTHAVQAFDESTSHLERESRLLHLVSAVLEHCAETPPPEHKLGKEHRAVTLVKEVLQTQPEYNHRLEDLAHLTGLSQHYLVEVFKRDVGLSPHLYQTSVRVHKAKDLLV